MKSFKKQSQERLDRINRAKVTLFNKTSDGCQHVKFEKRADESWVKMCKKCECACVYKLCPKNNGKKKKK